MQVHIGKEIERIYQNSGMKLSEFAKRINTSPRNVYSIFSRAEIKTDHLQKISKVLNYDFFELYRVAGTRAEEAEGKTQKRKVVISIELDGTQSLLDNNIKMLKTINDTI